MGQIPGVDSPLWRAVVTGERECNFQFLALQLFMGRARVVISTQPELAGRFALELRELFVANERHPKIQLDLATLIKE